MPPTCYKQTLRIWNSPSFPREDYSRAVRACVGVGRRSPIASESAPRPYASQPHARPYVQDTHTTICRPNHSCYMTAAPQLYFFFIIREVPENFASHAACVAKFRRPKSVLSMECDVNLSTDTSPRHWTLISYFETHSQ